MNKTHVYFMKVILALMVVVTMMSCEKPLIESGESKVDNSKEASNLTVSIYQIEHTPFASFSRTAISDASTRVNFAIYDADGTRVKQTNQQLGDADFGTASFQLAKGTYQVVVVAHSASSNPTMTDPTKIQFTNSTGYTDTFLSNQMVTIGDVHQNLSVSLNRIVSMCRFVITDNYPQEVATMRFQYKGGSGAFNAATGLGSVNSTQKLEVSAATGQKQFDLYTFLHSTEGTIHLTVTAHDASDNVINEQEFDVLMKQNEITWLSGPYFSDSNTQTMSMTLDVNTEWAGETHLTY